MKVSPCAVPTYTKEGLFLAYVDSQRRLLFSIGFPRLDDMLEDIGGCTIFSKIDLKTGYP